MATISILDNLPYSICDEIWIDIFRYLRPIEILRVRLVCKSWALLSTDIRLKNKLCLKLDTFLNTPKRIRAYMSKNETNYLPIRSLNVVDLIATKNLKFILRKIAPKVRCLKLTNSLIFKALAFISLPNLEELHFDFKETSKESIGDPQLEFLRSYKNLTSLNVKCSGELREFSLKVEQMVMLSNASLQRLYITFHWEHIFIFQHSLQKYATSLRELDIYFCGFACTYGLSEEEWNTLFNNLENLEILKLSGNCSSSMIALIFEGLPETAPLRFIELNGITTLTNDVLECFLNKWRNSIEDLSIYHNGKISKEGISKIQELRNLKSFSIGNCELIEFQDILFAIANHNNYTLCELHLQSINKVDEENLCILVNRLPNLKVLELTDVTNSITNRVLVHIFRYQTNLRELHLDYGCYDDLAIEGWGDKDWPTPFPITRLCNLEVLSLNRCDEIEDIIDYLVFPKLRNLYISKLEDIPTERFINLIENCPTLEVVHIFKIGGICDAIIEIFRNLKLLQKLSLETCCEEDMTCACNDLKSEPKPEPERRKEFIEIINV